ncbi:hypothetical protein C2I27_04025 [Priestia megaterium]|uniref:hypothetical protein n=1 Tax=Priestia megaterium TaxID=1404 RepID=UPI000D50655A|nr:hypothetical protein [Priestia megaterium]PVC75063.1 hypothetical protein C2I27_04025 [Priestia megaterium]
MATYTSDYMKRIAFLDGQVLHDFHINLLQKNVAEAIKLQTTRSKYDFYMLVSPYKMYFMEPFVNEDEKDANSTAVLNQLAFSINAGSWESTLLELPQVTEEICLVANFEDYVTKGAFVKFFYRTGKDNDWIPLQPDIPTYLAVPKKYIQIKAECTYTGTMRPALYDFALMWK